MIVQISKSLLRQMIQTNIQHNEIMTELLSSIDQAEQEQWVNTSTASELTGLDPARIRYLFRSKQIEGRKRGAKIIEVRLGDLQKYIPKKEAEK